MTPQERQAEIETVLHPRFPNLTTQLVQVSRVHWELRMPRGFWPPVIYLGPRGKVNIEEFRSYPSVRDGSAGALTALVERATW
jgi:hypothetical protein